MAEVGIIWADDSDLVALFDYVESQRPKIAQFPKLQGKIEDFEKWYQQLGWYDVHVMINDTLAEGFRLRNEVNSIMNQAPSPFSIPADLTGKGPGASSGLAAPAPPPWWKLQVPTWLKVTVVGVPAALVTVMSIGAVRKALWL